MEGDERDRQREMEEIEEIRKRIVDNQPEDMEQDQVSLDQNSQIFLKRNFNLCSENNGR